MIIVLSPSKGQTFDHPAPVTTHTLPDHLGQSKILINELKKCDVVDEDFLDVSTYIWR